MTSAIGIEASFGDEVQKNLNEWLNGDYDELTKLEIRRLLKENPQEIIDAFYTTLSFGTGGLRGIMGVGSNRINSYSIGMSVQGLCNYLKEQPKQNGGFSVLIGFDSRNHSREFAEKTAKVLAGNGIKALLFKSVRPTPLVSFGCRFKQCSAAIMITASHNPPYYNGCKIYWNDGGQVVLPHEKAIVEEIKKISTIKEVKSVPTLSHPLIEEMDREIDDAYITMITTLQNYREDNQRDGALLKIVYTSLHGTGIAVMPQAFAAWGFTNVKLVEEQVILDGNFPTAPSPNPEEKAALALGIAKLQEVEGDILIATDPDADRVGVAILHKGKVELISGNEIAVLLLEHMCEALTTRKKMPANAAFIKTIATTELFTAIAEYYQKPCFNVLPGFKYIAEKIRQWETDPRGRQFVFGCEESCGYLVGTEVRDKDAISASALICEMALQAKLKGKTLIDLLCSLYERHGIYQECLSTIPFPDTLAGKQKMERSIELLQSLPPKKILDCDILFVEDYKRSVRIDLKLRQTEVLFLPKSNALLYLLSDGSKIVVRPSGTEPKIKIYCGAVKKKFSSLEVGINECKQHAKALIEDFKQFLISTS